jgi:hypothetical protein
MIRVKTLRKRNPRISRLNGAMKPMIRVLTSEVNGTMCHMWTQMQRNPRELSKAENDCSREKRKWHRERVSWCSIFSNSQSFSARSTGQFRTLVSRRRPPAVQLIPQDSHFDFYEPLLKRGIIGYAPTLSPEVTLVDHSSQLLVALCRHLLRSTPICAFRDICPAKKCSKSQSECNCVCLCCSYQKPECPGLHRSAAHHSIEMQILQFGAISNWIQM